jgi:nucleoside-diphosphate-sugar epimerase
MSKKILVIGGTRFFGRTLVRKLAEAGNTVTILTRGLTGDDFGTNVRRIRVDRTDAAALQMELEDEQFDLVYDQMCYNPADARAICNILDGRIGHYIMASTIEAYGHLSGIVAGDYREDDINLSRLNVEFDRSWRTDNCDGAYGAGKRQAEAVIAKAPFKWSTVRIAHVLSGPDDFTGRLAAYVDLARSSAPLHHSAAPGESTFLTVEGIVDFLCWLGETGHGGVFNAGTDDPLTALDLYQVVCSTLGREPRTLAAEPGQELTPFDYAARHTLQNGRARDFGFSFGRIRDRIPGLVRAHIDRGDR